MLALLAPLCAAGPARAWEAHRAPLPDGQYVRFLDYPLRLRVQAPPISMHTEPPFEWLPAVRAALATWQAVPSASASFTFAGTVASGGSVEPAAGEVLVSFDAGNFPGAANVAGVTTVTLDALGSSPPTCTSTAATSPDASGKLQAQFPSSAAVPLGLALPAQLDVVLYSSSTRKGGEAISALTVATSCTAVHSGCGTTSAQPALLLLAPLALFLLRRRRIRSAAALALLACIAAPTPAQAYKRSAVTEGSNVWLWWGPRGHTFTLDAQGTPDVPGMDAFNAVRLSFAAWSAIPCSDLVFTELPISQNRNDRRVGYFTGEYNRNLVLWRTAACCLTRDTDAQGNRICSGGAVPPGDSCLAQGGCSNKYDCWDHDDAVIATTTTTSRNQTGEIVDSDIELNDAPSADGTRNVFSTADSPACSLPNQTDCVSTDIRNTVTHEAGHSIGLAHSNIPDSTMWASAPVGEIAKRAPHQDDIRAVCAIYPKGLPTSTSLGDPITVHVLGAGEVKNCGCDATGSAAPALQALGLSLTALALRRRLRAAKGRSPATRRGKS